MNGAIVQPEFNQLTGTKTGCLLYWPPPATSGTDEFSYTVCAEGRGCGTANVVVHIVCEYFGEPFTSVDFLLWKHTNIVALNEMLDTLQKLNQVKQLNQEYDPTSHLLDTNIHDWIAALKAFSKNSMPFIQALQFLVLEQLETSTTFSPLPCASCSMPWMDTGDASPPGSGGGY